MSVANNHRKAGTRLALALLFPSALATMAIVVLLPVLPLMLAHFSDLPGAEYRVPMLLTIPSACLVVAAPIAGWIADRVGRRRILIASMAIYAVVGMAPIVLDGYWAIFASRVGVGIVEAIVLTVSTTLIGDFFSGAERDRWLGYQMAVASLSATVLIFLGGLLSVFGWRGPFALYALALVLMLGVILFTWEPQPGAEHSPERGVPVPGWGSFPWMRMGGICAITLFASMMFYLVQIQLPLMLAAFGIPASAESGLFQAAVSLTIPLGAIIFHQLSALPPARLLTIAFILLGTGCIGMGWAPNARWLLASAAVDQLGAGMVLPTLLTWAIRGLPFELRGRGTGMWQGTFSIGQFLIPIAITLLSKMLDGRDTAIIAFGCVTLVLALAFMTAELARREPGRLVDAARRG